MGACSSHGPDGAPPAKAARVDSGWEDKILALGQYEHTLPDLAMPFVNRHSEIFQLFEANFRAVRTLSSRAVKDFRGLKVCFAAQMFGSGKTTLGENFVRQLSDPEFRKFADKQLAGKEEPYVKAFRDEWELAKKARTVYADIAGIENMDGVLVRVAEVGKTAAPRIPCTTPQVTFASVVEEIALQNVSHPVFVHLDELGSLGYGVSALRDSVRSVWQKMNEVREERALHIYFFLSGKGIPVDSIGKSDSMVGTKWILLDHLRQEHVGSVVQHLTRGAGLKLHATAESAGTLVSKLYDWTGGAPRLLLYSLRALHHLNASLQTAGEVDEAMERVFLHLKDITAVASDLFVDRARDRDLSEAWLRLMILAKCKVPCTWKDPIPVRAGKTFQVSELLRALNVYITREDIPEGSAEDQFFVHSFGLVDRYVRESFPDDFRVPLLFGAHGAAGLDPARLLERLVEQRIVVQACLSREGATWGTALPLLAGAAVRDEVVMLDVGACVQSMPKVTSNGSRLPPNGADEGTMLKMKTLHRDNYGDLVDRISSGRIYRPREKSSSCDTLIKHRGRFIEIQDKAYGATKLSMNDVAKEWVKCVPAPRTSTLLVVALTLDERLERWIGGGILVLPPGVYDEEHCEDEAGLSRLLFRGHDAEDWTHTIEGGAWSVAAAGMEGLGNNWQVRAGLEVVIPSVTAVDLFLGEDAAAVRHLATDTGSTKPLELSFASRFWGFAGSGPPPAKLDDNTGVITVVYGEVSKEVEFSRVSTAPEIKEAICLEVGIPVGTVIRLGNDRGRGVAINGSLKPCTYTVTVVPQAA